MAEDNTNFEAYLRSLSPTSLESDFAKRLNHAVNHTDLGLSDEEAETESKLSAVRPHRLSADYHERLLAAVGVKTRQSRMPKSKINWLAAAAVAMLGAFAAFMVPDSEEHGGDRHADVSARDKPSTGIQPAGLTRQLASAKDEGVVWPDGRAPHRVLRVTYHDQVTLKDPAGRVIEIEQPCIEYILVPAKID
jgi:hypothetical protein